MEAKTELQRNAIAEARRKELETYQRALDIQWLNSRMEDSCTGRQLALIKLEAEMERDFQERTDHAAIVNAQAQKEIALGTEIAKESREKANELLRRHYLRERDPQLRELIKKLQAGYVCRDLKQQILHNEYRQLQNKVEENRANRVLRDALYSDQEKKVEEDKTKLQNNIKYCKELQQQLVNRQQQRQCQYEESLIEKKMLEDIMRTLADEDQRELQQKREQMEKLRKEMVTFKRAREAWKEKQKTMLVNEERRIEKEQEAMLDRSSSILAERQRKLDIKEKINNKIASKMLADEEERLERENIIKMLQEQEYLEKNVQDDKAVHEKAERIKRETKESLTAQMETRQRLIREAKERDANLRKAMLSELAAIEEKEKEKERKCKEKNRQYFKELQRQIEENEQRRKWENEMEENRAKYVFDTETAWDAEVAEERKKVIEEHASHLLGYLQPGVIQKADIQALSAGVQNIPELSNVDLQAMSKSGAVQRHPKCNPQCMVLRRY